MCLVGWRPCFGTALGERAVMGSWWNAVMQNLFWLSVRGLLEVGTGFVVLACVDWLFRRFIPLLASWMRLSEPISNSLALSKAVLTLLI